MNFANPFHRAENDEEFERDSYDYAMNRIVAFAGQKPADQEPIATYYAKEDLDKQEREPSYFDMSQLKPGEILRLEAGGTPFLHDDGVNPNIYIYLVAGLSDSNDKPRLYEVCYVDQETELMSIMNPYLFNTLMGFRLNALACDIQEPPYSGSPFVPIHRINQYLGIGGVRFSADAPISEWDTHSIDVMVAGKKKQGHQPISAAAHTTLPIRSLIPAPVVGNI